MKYIIFLGDGMADEPETCENGLTPLMVAETPNIDSLIKKSKCGSLVTIPFDMPAGSSVANMSILGYDVYDCYEGRGVLEAANLGIPIYEDEVGIRCNLITIKEGRIKNHSAGHISSEEAKVLIEYLEEHLGDEFVKFYPGISFRNVLVMKNGSKEVTLTPPHDVPGVDFMTVMPKQKSEEGYETAQILRNLILKSQELLKNHPINQKRIAMGKDPANSIWFYSIGHKPKISKFEDKYKMKAAIISAVDLINGIGVYAGMDVIKVNGATGLYDTNYEGKADACIEALKTHDLVYVHVEASDEAGHEGDFDLKVKTIEYFDQRLIGRFLSKVNEIDDYVKIAVLPDHPTPVESKIHTRKPVPFFITQVSGESDGISRYDEISIRSGSYGKVEGKDFLNVFFDIKLE